MSPRVKKIDLPTTYEDVLKPYGDENMDTNKKEIYGDVDDDELDSYDDDYDSDETSGTL